MVVRSKGSYLKRHHLCARKKLRTSLPAFWSGPTVSSKGPGTRSSKGSHCMDMNKMEGQEWSQYCQRSYICSVFCLLFSVCSGSSLCETMFFIWLVARHLAGGSQSPWLLWLGVYRLPEVLAGRQPHLSSCLC